MIRTAYKVGVAVLLGAGVGAQVRAAEIGYAEGTEVIASDKVDIYVEDKASGRMVSVGSNKSRFVRETKGTGLFHNLAKSCSPAVWDLIRGTGTGAGYCKAARGADSYVLEFNGYCATLVGADSKPNTKCSGAWKLLAAAGTGKFAGVDGVGQWWGQFNEAGEFEEQWNAHYQK
ncbi:MAG: hypothetical protein U1F52_17330 [Burkholderiales bacterium]